MLRPTLLFRAVAPARQSFGLASLCLALRPSLAKAAADPALATITSHRGFASTPRCPRQDVHSARSQASSHAPPSTFPSSSRRLPAAAAAAATKAAFSPIVPATSTAPGLATAPSSPISKSAKRRRRLEDHKGRRHLGRNVTIITKPPPDEAATTTQRTSSPPPPNGRKPRSSGSRFALSAAKKAEAAAAEAFPDASSGAPTPKHLAPAPVPDTFPTLRAATSLQSSPGPYFVRRTPFRGLPVYQRKKAGGNMLVTLIKGVEGDREVFRQELAAAMALEYKNVQENHVTGHIHVPGHLKRKILVWLSRKGF